MQNPWSHILMCGNKAKGMMTKHVTRLNAPSIPVTERNGPHRGVF